MKISILGPRGTFSEYAASEYFGKDDELILCKTIAEAVTIADEGKADCAFVPVENSLEGSVTATMDSLVKAENLHIIAEHKVKIHHCLMAPVAMENVKNIVSHPQPIGQCAEFLASLDNVSVSIADSTAAAALTSASSADTAVIGSKALSSIYNLKVLCENIEDNHNNETRFILLSKNKAAKSEKNKTSIVFSVPDKPGELLKMLSVLDIFEINMNKIESRPAKTHLGEYLFFIDIDGYEQDENVTDAIEVMKKKSIYFKVLGSYPGE